MRIMTRILPDVSEALGDQDFVRGIHSVGLPRPVKRKRRRGGRGYGVFMAKLSGQTDKYVRYRTKFQSDNPIDISIPNSYILSHLLTIRFIHFFRESDQPLALQSG